MAGGEFVLITGATGHIGYRVLLDALKAGYKIRAAVRNSSKADALSNAPAIKALSPGDNLTFVEVPDLTIPGAYDEAVKGAELIIHIASPLASAVGPDDDPEEKLITPAVKGTIGLLESAKKAGTAKRIVITSSIAAVLSASGKFDGVYDGNSRTQWPSRKGPFPNTFLAYAASKSIALNDTEEWIAKEKPSFDVIHLMPSFVLGPNEFETDPQKSLTYGSNRIIMALITGRDLPPMPGGTVHLDDVADAHLAALTAKVEGNPCFLLNSGPIEGNKLEDVWSIVSRLYPDEVASGKLTQGKSFTLPAKADASAATKQLGIQYKDFESQIKGLVDHYLKLTSGAAA